MAVLIDETSRILVQGITGREAVTFTKDSLDYGARIVAGVTPGKGGQHVYGVPVYDHVADAVAAHAPDVSVVSVPPAFAADAAVEALECGIRLVVIMTERVPRRDVVQVLAVADALQATVIGPNSLGVISPERSKAGSVGGPARDVAKSYRRGPVGVMSRSGGMTTEIAHMLTQAGLGQSTCVSIGGDPVVGLTMVELLRLFEKDEETEAVVFFSEPGGSQDQALADYVAEGRCRLPVIGFVAGLFADDMPGVRFGHAGAMVEPGGTTTRDKIAALRRAGVTVVDRLSQLPEAVKAALGRADKGRAPGAGDARRAPESGDPGAERRLEA